MSHSHLAKLPKNNPFVFHLIAGRVSSIAVLPVLGRNNCQSLEERCQRFLLGKKPGGKDGGDRQVGEEEESSLLGVRVPASQFILLLRSPSPLPELLHPSFPTRSMISLTSISMT